MSLLINESCGHSHAINLFHFLYISDVGKKHSDAKKKKEKKGSAVECILCVYTNTTKFSKRKKGKKKKVETTRDRIGSFIMPSVNVACLKGVCASAHLSKKDNERTQGRKPHPLKKEGEFY